MLLHRISNGGVVPDTPFQGEHGILAAFLGRHSVPVVLPSNDKVIKNVETRRREHIIKKVKMMCEVDRDISDLRMELNNLKKM